MPRTTSLQRWQRRWPLAHHYWETSTGLLPSPYNAQCDMQWHGAIETERGAGMALVNGYKTRWHDAPHALKVAGFACHRLGNVNRSRSMEGVTRGAFPSSSHSVRSANGPAISMHAAKGNRSSNKSAHRSTCKAVRKTSFISGALVCSNSQSAHSPGIRCICDRWGIHQRRNNAGGTPLRATFGGGGDWPCMGCAGVPSVSSVP